MNVVYYAESMNNLWVKLETQVLITSGKGNSRHTKLMG
jgi:hypothetical protein